MLEMEVPDQSRRGRPQRRCMDVMKVEMEQVDVRVEKAGDRARGRQMIRCDNLSWKKPKDKEEYTALDN